MRPLSLSQTFGAILKHTMPFPRARFRNYRDACAPFHEIIFGRKISPGPIYILWDKILLNIDLSSFGGPKPPCPAREFGLGEHELSRNTSAPDEYPIAVLNLFGDCVGGGGLFYMVVPLNAIWGGFILFRIGGRWYEAAARAAYTLFFFTAQSKTTWKKITKKYAFISRKVTLTSQT